MNKPVYLGLSIIQISKTLMYEFWVDYINPIQDGLFRGCSRTGGWGGRGFFYNDETWHSYTLPKENPKKCINHVTHSLGSADISIFSPKISKFCYIKKYTYRLDFDT